MGYHYTSAIDPTYLDLYVAPSPEGDDVHTETSWAQALETVTKALETAVNGTRIRVKSGTYTGGDVFPLTIEDRTSVQILGTYAAETVFDAGDRANT